MAESLGKDWNTLFVSQMHAVTAFFKDEPVDPILYTDSIYSTKFHLAMSILTWSEDTLTNKEQVEYKKQIRDVV
jgi:hypothetical protein